MEDLFVKEDISKPENRVNLAIFHLMMVDEFRKWFYGKLNIDLSSVIYPVTNSGGNRPDMVIKKGSNIIGCIEVELGSENVSQTQAYSKQYERIYTISGLKSHNTHLSLEEMKDSEAAVGVALPTNRCNARTNITLSKKGNKNNLYL